VFSASQDVLSVTATRPRVITRLADRAPAAIALAGAALLVLQWAHGRMLWLDEEMIAINIRDRPFGALAGPLSLGQAAPYGWLAMQRTILLAAGAGERALRFLPVAFGVATLGAAVWIGRRWMTAWGAATLVFLCAFGQWISFHALELKHYSADVCFGLFLPALAVWATERRAVAASSASSIDPESDPLAMRRRIRVWWIAGAASHWMSNGALFVAPSCGFVLWDVARRRFGWREAFRSAAPAALWAASFALNYAVALGPARSSDFLRGYWAPAFPPAGAGLTGTLSWLAGQIVPLAIKPGGSGWPVVFWAAAAAGFVLGRPRGSGAAFRAAYALVPVAAFAWTAIRLVPMSERLTLWMVPAVYVGIALCADRDGRWLAEGITARRAARAGVGIAVLVVLAMFAADVFRNGMTYIALKPAPNNHELDDRGAIRWLARQARDGDVWIATWNSLPAIWWYAAPDPRRILESSFAYDAAACGSREVGASLAARQARRALVYFGFGHDIPPEYDDAMLGRLSEIGTVAAYRRFGRLGHAVVIDIGGTSRQPVTMASLAGDPALARSRGRTGCVSVQPARPW
jgi:hypothetical protein